jgi:SAM-dependent methyltransferase
MEAYTGFAQVYDMFMDNIPYEQWSQYLIKLLAKYGVRDGIILDMGCGTGNVTQCLARKGYDLIGIDNSQEMLTIAMEKIREKEERILYLLQDMREFELYGTVSAVVSICDSMNYIILEEELLEIFRLVNNYLDPQGVFIFDLNTVYKYKNILADNTIAENRDESSFIWDNNYYEAEMINEYDLTIYVKKQDEENIFRRFDETHYQKAYELETIKYLLEKAGMEFVAAFDAFTEEAPTEHSERIYIVARERHQDFKYYGETE